jgi:hypothetical protein
MRWVFEYAQAGLILATGSDRFGHQCLQPLQWIVAMNSSALNLLKKFPWGWF